MDDLRRRLDPVGIPYLFIKIAVDGDVTPGVLAWGRITRARAPSPWSIIFDNSRQVTTRPCHGRADGHAPRASGEA